jgi:hypothetical protein
VKVLALFAVIVGALLVARCTQNGACHVGDSWQHALYGCE